MTTQAASSAGRMSSFEQLRLAREIIRHEAAALVALSNRLQAAFTDAVKLLLDCRGSVIVSGMGKAGLIGQKISATLASTGTRSHFLHPAEAIHGDLGRISGNDVVLMLSFSGETSEVVELVAPLAQLGVSTIALTGKSDCTLGRDAAVTLEVGSLQEACSLGLAPSTSTTAMLALGDALALVASQMRGFSREDFARFHPGGSLGQKLAKVDECMRPLEECRIARENQSVREIFTKLGRPGRRTGAIMIVDDEHRLTGIFTDSDLARLFEADRNEAFDQPIRDVMTRSPSLIESGARMTQARDFLATQKISELPVVDSNGKPVGLIDITDLVGFEHADQQTSQSAKSRVSTDAAKTDAPPATLPFRQH